MSSNFLEQFEQNILSTWEEVYKKGQLTLWLLLALKKSPKDMYNTKAFILESTNNSLTVDDMSMYRALRRLVQMKLIDFNEQDSPKGGPNRKVYELTGAGTRVLGGFIRRNISGIFYEPKTKKIILEGEK